MRRYKDPILISLIIVLSLSVVRYMHGSDYWLADISSHFPFQYALISLTLMFVCIWRKSVLLAILAGLIFILNISVIIDFEGSIHAAEQPGKPFVVYSANIQVQNRDLSKLELEIQKIDPEIVLLVEVSADQDELLRSLKQSYPYCISSIPEDVVGVVFLSKFPLHDHHVTKLSEQGNLLFEARVEIDQRSVIFYGLHAQRPRFGNYKERISQFLRLVRQINEQSLPVIVAGDFNTTPYSPIFRKVIKLSGLKDAREGFGWQPSWPTFFPPLWIPIDHVLVSPEVQVFKRSTGSYIGSDHYPVITELFLG